MKSIKSNIPDQTVLDKLVRDEVGGTYAAFRQLIAADYSIQQRAGVSFIAKVVLVLLLYVLLFLILFLSTLIGSSILIQVSGVLVLFSPLLVILSIGYLFLNVNKNTNLPKKFSEYVALCLTKLLGCKVTCLYFEDMFAMGVNKTLANKINDTKLVNLPVINSVSSGAAYKIEADTTIVFYEVTLNDKNGPFFQGTLAEVTFDKPFLGITIISAENDKNYFHHKGLLMQSSELVEQVLEWNEFEKNISVSSTNPIEARRILSPDFMADLYDWWDVEKDSIRISFIENKMYVLVPGKKIKPDFYSALGNQTAFASYVQTILYPVWRTLILVEDTNN